jgi:opacity protein-like surface antigen
MKLIKAIILSALILLFPVLIFGQQNFASISFGTSIPLNDYAKAEDLSKNGYAKPGAAIKFDAAYFPGSYLGIGGSIGFGSNSAQKDSLMQDMIDHVLNNSQSIIDIPDYADITYGSGFWNYINAFLGPHFSVRPTNRLYIDLKFLAGLTVLRPPDQELIIIYDDTEIHTRTGRSKLTFGFTTGAGLRFKLNEDLALKFGADYFQCNANYDIEFDLFSGVAEEIEPVHASYKIQTVEVYIGLAYAF